MGAKRKIEIRKVSRFGIWITLFLALAFVFLIIQGENEFFAMNESTEQYIQGEKAAQQLEKGQLHMRPTTAQADNLKLVRLGDFR